MATVRGPHHKYLYAEYLAIEETSNTRHEFDDGEIYAMGGGSPEHAAACASITIAIGRQLGDRPCRVYSSDLRVRVLETGLATYPDVTVVCGTPEIDPLNRHTITNPIVLVEVLSPSTADYDRGGKLGHYKRIASLREVVLVAHDERRIEVWRREGGEEWTRTEARSGAIRLASIGASLDVDEIYRSGLAPA